MTDLADRPPNVVFPVLPASGAGAKCPTKPLKAAGRGQCSVYSLWVLDAVVAVISHQSQAPEQFLGIVRAGMGESVSRSQTKAIQGARGDDDTLENQQL